MKKSEFFFKIILYIFAVLVPLTFAGIMTILVSDGVGMIILSLAFFAGDIYFGIRLYLFIKYNKDMLI